MVERGRDARQLEGGARVNAAHRRARRGSVRVGATSRQERATEDVRDTPLFWEDGAEDIRRAGAVVAG